MNAAYTRTVRYDPDIAEVSSEDYYASYINIQTGQLIPNTKLYSGDQLLIDINSYGCKGPEPKEGCPSIGCFGDSTTFGVGLESWPSRLMVPGVQNINAAVEGHPIDKVIGQYERLKDDLDFVAGIFYPGWHNIIYNDITETYWRQQFDRISELKIVAVCTLANALVEECVEKGVLPLLNSEPGRNFSFWGDLEPSLEKVREVYDGIQRYNKFVRSIAAEKGWMLVDFEQLLRPKSYEQVTDKFFDILHMRVEVYPLMAAQATQTLLAPVSELLAERKVSAAEGGDKKGQSRSSGKMQKRSREEKLYPLW